MHRDSGLDFEHSFDSDSTCSYLVLKFNSDIKLLNHQTEIICQNPNPAFVPFHIRREDENMSIYYNITSKISLTQYLERKMLCKKELLNLLKSITKNLMLHGNYLLDLSSFVIELDFIYINPATAEVSLVYIPISCDRDIMKVCSTFLKDLAVNSANVDDSAKDNYLQRILNYLKSDSFNLNDFNRLIIDLRNSGGSYESAVKSTHEYGERAAKEEKAASGNIPLSKVSKNNAYKMVGKNKNILSIMLVQLLIILAAAIACLLMMSQAMGDPISIAGVLLIAAALDMLIMKGIAMKRSRKDSEVDTYIGAEADSNESPHNTAHKRSNRYNGGKNQGSASTLDVQRACDTIMISEAPLDDDPYLDSVGTNTNERITINKDKFIIGRLGSMVDYIIQGSTVGKLHAEVLVNEGAYYIRDLNSKNGTYINNVRITSNTECEIKNNDKIRFSSYEYVFRQ